MYIHMPVFLSEKFARGGCGGKDWSPLGLLLGGGGGGGQMPLPKRNPVPLRFLIHGIRFPVLPTKVPQYLTGLG